MNRWKPISITHMNHPVLFSGEKILFIQPSVELYDPSFFKTFPKNGTVYLTTHRICCLYPSISHIQSLSLDLSQIEKLDTSMGFFKSSSKIIIYYKKIQPPNNLNTSSKTVTESNTILASNINPWICTICSFSNPILENYTIDQSLPPCLACGVSNHFLPNRPKDSLVTVSCSKKDTSSLECQRCTFLNHPALKHCESCGAQLISEKNDTILLDSDTKFNHTYPSKMQQDIINDYCKIEFKSGGGRLFYERLKEALNDKAWAIIHSPIQRHNVDENRIMGGISVFQHEKENIQLNNARILSHGLSDLHTLMSKAKELVNLANSLRLQLQTSSDTSHNAQDVLQTSLQTMGLQASMSSQDLSNHIVTKAITKDDRVYYIELAKQVAAFLENGILKKEGGTMTLVDVFALYNRARGVDLISPEDLFKACQCYKTLNLSIQLKHFKSGLLVLQEKEKSEEKMIQQIVAWIQMRSSGVSPFDVADQFHWSMGITYEVLMTAEKAGLLCRDVCLEGLYFWENQFH